ncbi:hypothetical protein C8J57DRAFT_1252724 [Mycena rebaudengoi]|nr:hypothetical protein C8J57DRAFT_1252724 [Mycena rebaudengoi]
MYVRKTENREKTHQNKTWDPQLLVQCTTLAASLRLEAITSLQHTNYKRVGYGIMELSKRSYSLLYLQEKAYMTRIGLWTGELFTTSRRRLYPLLNEFPACSRARLFNSMKVRPQILTTFCRKCPEARSAEAPDHAHLQENRKVERDARAMKTRTWKRDVCGAAQGVKDAGVHARKPQAHAASPESARHPSLFSAPMSRRESPPLAAARVLPCHLSAAPGVVTLGALRAHPQRRMAACVRRNDLRRFYAPQRGRARTAWEGLGRRRVARTQRVAQGQALYTRIVREGGLVAVRKEQGAQGNSPAAQFDIGAGGEGGVSLSARKSARLAHTVTHADARAYSRVRATGAPGGSRGGVLSGTTRCLYMSASVEFMAASVMNSLEMRCTHKRDARPVERWDVRELKS